MARMQVAYYKGRTRIFNRVVSWWLSGPYSHTELVLDEVDGLSECGSSSFMDGGVRVKFMKLDPEHWDLVDVDGDVCKARQWFRDHRGDQYGLLGLLGFVWRRGTRDNNKRICSEAIAAALGYVEPWRFDPMGFWAATARRYQSATFENAAHG